MLSLVAPEEKPDDQRLGRSLTSATQPRSGKVGSEHLNSGLYESKVWHGLIIALVELG